MEEPYKTSEDINLTMLHTRRRSLALSGVQRSSRLSNNMVSSNNLGLLRHTEFSGCERKDLK